MSNDKSDDRPIESLIRDDVDNDVLEKVRKRIESRSILEEKCGNVRNVIVCEGDEVVVRVGRLWYAGVVITVNKLGIALLNNVKETGIALGKISVVEIVKRGEIYKKVFGNE